VEGWEAKQEPLVMASPELWLKKMSYLNLCYAKKACLLGMPGLKSVRNMVLSGLVRRSSSPSAKFRSHSPEKGGTSSS